MAARMGGTARSCHSQRPVHCSHSKACTGILSSVCCSASRVFASTMADPLLQPSGKVLCHPGGLYEPQLVWNHQRVWLGVHGSRSAAEAAYDCCKLLVSCVRGQEEGGQAAQL